MTLQNLGHPFAYDMECLVRLFYPGEKMDVTGEERVDDAQRIGTRLSRDGATWTAAAWLALDGKEAHDEVRFPDPGEQWEWESKRRMSVALFGLLCAHTGQRPPWGILTGVRPVRVCRKLMARGLSFGDAKAILTEDFLVQPNKVRLALDTMIGQDMPLRVNEPDTFSLYIGIPFCPTRCLYCSFVSHAIDRTTRLVPDYLELLCRELALTGAVARELDLRLKTVYVGGGTPTTLEPEQLETLLRAVAENFDFSEVQEYTVEAGRPDTITPGKLAVLRNFGVERVSINPQTMDDTILKAIGRDHTVQQVLDGVAMARAAGFSSLNMDLIAGLPLETAETFAATLQAVLALEPENVTVHTLTVKRSSDLRWQEDAYRDGPVPLGELLDQAQERLQGAGYRPYYLYRQQGTRQNHENTGYSLPHKEGLYNVLSMEDRHTILAAGSGAVTKLCAPGDRLQRVFNYKFPYEYISGFERLMERKEEIRRFFDR